MYASSFTLDFINRLGHISTPPAKDMNILISFLSWKLNHKGKQDKMWGLK